ncbi:MAG TPA: IS4 family transposase [Candidatus Eisenbacteria bacterium]|nr:IS4 family transposase [Candidatus Eisenbacteria bacterium]
MSDTYRRYRAIKRTLLQTLSARPNSHREKHINTLAALICGIVGAQHTQLPKIAAQIPSGKTKRESQIKRFDRFLDNQKVAYEVYFLPFAQALLLSLSAQPLPLIMDGSVVGRGCISLMLCVVYQRRALPLAWVVVRGKKGHFPETSHCALLAQIQPYVPQHATVVFLGDGEFDGTNLQATITDYGWRYACRTASTTVIWSGDARVHFGDLGVQSDEVVVVEDVQVTLARYGPVLALAVWEAAYAEPLYLVSNLADAEAALEWYRQRATIETFFSDQKSRGFHIHKSHLSDPARLTRLLLAACLAYLWMVYLGSLALRQGWQAIIHRHDRCDLSLFQLGLRLLNHWLNESLRIRVAFCPSLR